MYLGDFCIYEILKVNIFKFASIILGENSDKKTCEEIRQLGVVAWLGGRRIDLVRDLLQLLLSTVIERLIFGCAWQGDVFGVYLVWSAYAELMEASSTVVGFSDNQVTVLGRLWRSISPPKVIAFSWQLLLERVPTRLILVRRRVILDRTLAFECSAPFA